VHRKRGRSTYNIYVAIYNKKHKFLLSHVSKCGGTAIMNGLKEVVKEPSIELPSHSMLDYINKCIEKEDQNPKEYKKITLVRNPWDRAVSLYYHMIGYEKRMIPNEKGGKVKFEGNFDDFLNLMTPVPENHYEKFGYVISFENLQVGFNFMCKELGLKQVKLKKFDYNTGRPKDYRSMYNKKSIDFIYNMNKDIIKKFNYTF